MPFNLENEGKLLGQIQGGKFNKKFVYITDKDSEEVSKNLPHIHIGDDGVFQQVPDPELERQIIYVFGPSGSGKSTYSRNYIDQWKKKHKDGEIFLFSSLKEDASLDPVGPIRINIGENLLDNPIEVEQFENSLVIFDDIDVIRDKDFKEAVYDILNSILETGRHFHIDCILTNHLPSNGKDTRRILNECHSITFFPLSGITRQTKYFLENYAGLDAKEIKKLKKLGSRWATIFKSYPMCVMTMKDLFTFDEDD